MDNLSNIYILIDISRENKKHHIYYFLHNW